MADDTSRIFSIRIDHEPDRVQVRVFGELDISRVPELDRALSGLIGPGHDRVQINLNGVDFLDSSGLAAIVRAEYEATSHDQPLTVRYSSPQIDRLLKLTGMIDHLVIE